MTRKHVLSLSFTIAMLLSFMSFSDIKAQPNQNLQGIWIGKMEIKPDLQLSVAFEVKSDGSAVMHSLDQQAYDIKVDELQLQGQAVLMKINAINGIYKGRMINADSISGGINQGGGESLWPLHLTKATHLPKAKPKRPQEPAGELPYTQENISYRNERAGVTLSGTLTAPKTPGPHPAVLLMPGSGPSDRDQTIFGHKVFLVWADLLTRAGYIVLRVDDRGTAESEGDYAAATLDELASDAVAGVSYLKTRKEVNAERIGLIGHSLGAQIAPIAATQTSDIAFVVLMAGATEPLTKGLIEQTEAVYAQAGASREGIALNTEILQVVFKIVSTEEDTHHAKLKLAQELERLNPRLAKLSAQDLKKLELTYPIDPKAFHWFLTPSGKSELLSDPAQSLRKVKCPVLAMNGTKDVQVLPYNLSLVEKELRKGGNRQVTVKEWENKNHLFQTAKTGSVGEYGEIEETVAPEVIAYMVGWMNSLQTSNGK